MSNSLHELKLNDHKNWIISDLILKQAKKFSKFNIIEFIDKEKWTYEDILSKGLKASFRLKKNGLTNGDSIVVMIDNPKVFIPIWLGACFLGIRGPSSWCLVRGGPYVLGTVNKHCKKYGTDVDYTVHDRTSLERTND